MLDIRNATRSGTVERGPVEVHAERLTDVVDRAAPTAVATRAAKDKAVTTMEINVLWRVLADDSGVGVVVLDTRTATAVETNGRFARFFGQSTPEAMAGRAWSEVAGDVHGQDMLERARLVAQTGEPLSVRSVWRGEALLTIYRPVDPAKAPGRVIATVRFLGATAQTSEVAADVRAGPRGPVDLGRLACLTAREREIVVLIAQGLSTNEIAAKLHRTQKTVEAHRNSIGNKLGIKNRVQLALLALGAGLESM